MNMITHLPRSSQGRRQRSAVSLLSLFLYLEPLQYHNLIFRGGVVLFCQLLFQLDQNLWPHEHRHKKVRKNVPFDLVIHTNGISYYTQDDGTDDHGRPSKRAKGSALSTEAEQTNRHVIKQRIEENPYFVTHGMTWLWSIHVVDLVQ